MLILQTKSKSKDCTGINIKQHISTVKAAFALEGIFCWSQLDGFYTMLDPGGNCTAASQREGSRLISVGKTISNV